MRDDANRSAVCQDQAADMGFETAGFSGVTSRRSRFLRNRWSGLGPTQQQHLSIHCRTVAAMAARLGRGLGLGEMAVRRLHVAGLLHDVGKCMIDESLLAKPARLTDAEREVMATHSLLGARIAESWGADRLTVNLILHHHRPYASDTSADALPRAEARQAQTLCVADALVSMLTDRPYARARSIAQALFELQRCSGQQFDPVVVRMAQQVYQRSQAA